MGGCVGRRWREKSLGHGAVSDRNAKRRRRGRVLSTARCKPERSARRFTASQGLLLMIPNMYKIAGELTPSCCFMSRRGRSPRMRFRFSAITAMSWLPRHRVGNALFGLSPGGDGLRADCASGHPRIAHSVSAFLRRVSHVARDFQNRGCTETMFAGDDRRGAHNRASRSRAVAGPPGDSRHGTESRTFIFRPAKP